ncbi:ABC transporter substrate-binding protein [Geochorda subterranea]|uniref:Sugar ABC transporter substrate-binding protein n=1 Tax=Geochorda subterranea TaxID=3109564 RepID=A0ABZ1BRJ9_9FIRM|nr:sugar ABC transporter substrate-binding protein [Limnochorda sp. LNt]WRP15140.1 sugar ABC transporter substrate-binding protein [Limnochorda sp. LNt]
MLVTAVPVAAAQKVELRLMSWYFGEEPAATGLKTLIAEFERTHPGISIVPEQVTDTERLTKLTTRMAGGQGPDMYMETASNVRFVVDRGYCINLEPLIAQSAEPIKQRFSDGILEEFSDANGNLYFMPYAIGPTALVYNSRMWRAAGLDPANPPKTWESFVEYAKKLTGNGRYGLAMFGKGDGSSVWRLSYWWMTNGADVLSSDGQRATVNTPEFIEAIEFWANLHKVYHVVPPSAPQNSFSENNAIFAAEVAAMVESGVWQFGVTEKMNPSLKGELRAALMPVRRRPVAAGGGDDGICITTQSKHPKEAFEFLSFLSSAKAGVTLWQIHGKFPANKASLQDPAVAKDSLVQMWLPILPYTKAPVLHPRYPEISSVLGVMQQEVLLGLKSAAQAVADANAKITEIIERK